MARRQENNERKQVYVSTKIVNAYKYAQKKEKEKLAKKVDSIRVNSLISDSVIVDGQRKAVQNFKKDQHLRARNWVQGRFTEEKFIGHMNSQITTARVLGSHSPSMSHSDRQIKANQFASENADQITGFYN